MNVDPSNFVLPEPEIGRLFEASLYRRGNRIVLLEPWSKPELVELTDRSLGLGPLDDTE